MCAEIKIETAVSRRGAGTKCLVRACLAAVLLLLAGVRAAAAQEGCWPSLEARQRYGYVALSADWSQAFAIDTLNAGWYVNPSNHTPAPQGMDQTLVIRTPSGYTLDRAVLGALVDANPGATWLIGSEPDCIWQDDVWPEEYAHIYHDLYIFIKNRDQMSQVAAGGIVQPTPLRLQYLDRVLAAYEAGYGRPLPADLWHIHNAILNEERGSWGADIPPGIEADQGVIRSVDDNDNLWIFQSQVRAFRQWMTDRGYGGYPLVITEYGVLMPDDYGFDVARVNRYMGDTFSYLAAATDPVLGAPWDGGRLVQRWTWFSLDVGPWDPFTGEGFNGNLFDPDTTAITAHGQHFAGLTAGLEPLLHVDLGLGRWQVAPSPAVVSPTQTVDRPVAVRLVNAGTADAAAFQVRLTYEGPMGGALVEAVDGLAAQSAQWIDFVLPGLAQGGYTLTLEMDVDDQVDESAECNNRASRRLVVSSRRYYLPLALDGAVHQGVGQRGAASGLASMAPAAVSREAEPRGLADDAAPIIVEYPLPQAGSYPGQLALDPASGVLWVTERDGNRIARFDPATESWQEYDLPTADSQPWGLALDAAGDVWFAETAANQIGKMEAASGTITEYGELTAGSQPWGVAVSDGVVWFTQRAADQIGRLEIASGQIVEYSVPSAGAYPGGIAVYDDNVWFAETGVDQLGRFQISKQLFYEFQTTPWEDPLLGPEDVTVIPPGNPWLSNTGGNGITIFRFSTLQNFGTIQVPTPASEPYGITIGGPRSIWFTERAGNKVGRYGPQESIIEYALPMPGSQPTDIVVDGEGCAWYAAPGTNRIGRVCPRFIHLPLVLRLSEV